jgi:hypothetical protein
MSKLFLAGCSFSDNYQAPKNYGSKLAKLLGVEYKHLAIGIGSNYRMWRYITNNILTGNLTKNDLLVVQYTNVERNEFWSAIDRKFPESPEADISETYPKGGTILKFKIDSHSWHTNPIEDEFQKMYQDNFLSPDFEQEKFLVHNHMFQCMLERHGIKTVFFYSRYLQDYPVLDSFKPYIYTEPKEFINDETTYKHIVTDRYHLSEDGHTQLADRLYNHIKSFPSGVLI